MIHGLIYHFSLSTIHLTIVMINRSEDGYSGAILEWLASWWVIHLIDHEYHPRIMD